MLRSYVNRFVMRSYRPVRFNSGAGAGAGAGAETRTGGGGGGGGVGKGPGGPHLLIPLFVGCYLILKKNNVIFSYTLD
jgi:hypothetical protein